MNLSDALGSIAILLPGYLGAWLMSTIIGIRKREWPQTVLYSLIFSAFTYLIALRLMPEINHLTIVDNLGFQKSINQVSNLGTQDTKLTFNSAIKIAAFCIPISLILGFIAGKIRTSTAFRKFFAAISGRTQNSDIWSDFHEKYRIGPHTIVLRNGDAVLGRILYASDTLVGSDRGLIVEHPVYYEAPIISQITGTQAKMVNTPGNMLILYDQISYIFDSKHPASLLRAQRKLRLAQMRRPIPTLIRKIRRILSR